MTSYKTILSALLTAPIICGIGIKMLHGYQSAANAAEQYMNEYETQMEQTTALMEQVIGSDTDMDIDILSEDFVDDYDIETDDIEDDPCHLPDTPPEMFFEIRH